MAADAGIRVLVADDQASVRQGLEVILNSEPDLVVAGFATNGEEAVSHVAELRPDVVLMDLKMSKLNGTHATRCIIQQIPGARCWCHHLRRRRVALRYTTRRGVWLSAQGQ